VAWPQSIASSTGTQLVAGTGDRLVAFTLAVTQPQEDAGYLGESSAVHASLEVGGAVLSVSMDTINQQIQAGTSATALTTGTDSFAASVPAHQHHVVLVLTEGSFSQSLNLWTLARVPPAPAVLYRDPRSPSVSGTPSGTVQLDFTNPADGFTATDSTDVATTTLTWFAPDQSGTTPADPNRAFLVVNMQSASNEGDGAYIASFTPLPTSLFSFTPSGGTAIPATTAPQITSSGEANGDDGLFDALYWFAVPATTTTGTLTIGAGTVNGTQYTGYVGTQSGPITITAPATITLSFPAVPAAAQQSKPTWVNAPLPATGIGAAAANGASGSAGHGGNSSFPIWLAVLLLVLVAAAVVVAQRWYARRRIVPVLVPSTPAPVVIPTAVGAVRQDEPVAVPHADDHAPAATPTPSDRSGDPMLKVLGPVEYDSYRQAPDRRVIEELLCWLVLHSQHSHNADEIQLALRPTDGSRPEPTRKTFHSYLSALRQCIGAEHLPDATGAGGYRINGIDCDWLVFQRLSGAADKTTGVPSIGLRTEALALVRGVPFQGVARGQYEWVFTEDLHTDMAKAVVACALRLSSDLMALGRYKVAEDAARAGLRAALDDEHLKRARDRAVEARNEGLAHPGRTIGDDPPIDPDDPEDPANPEEPAQPT